MKGTWILMLAITRVILQGNRNFQKLYKIGISSCSWSISKHRHRKAHGPWGHVRCSQLTGKSIIMTNTGGILSGETLMLKHLQLKQKIVNSVSVFAKWNVTKERELQFYINGKRSFSTQYSMHFFGALLVHRDCAPTLLLSKCYFKHVRI